MVPLDFHKMWCESERKANLVIEEIGGDISVYKLNDRKSPAILDLNPTSGWSLFGKKTEI